MTHAPLQQAAGVPVRATGDIAASPGAVARAPAVVRRACVCGGTGSGGSCPECSAAADGPKGWLQPKLVVGATDDPLERAADRTAEAVVRQADGQPPAAEGGHVQDAVAGRVAPPTVRDTISSPGRPLDAATRASMQDQFGYDFSRVRVHADTDAAGSAADVAARAYTVGSHVVFGAGQFAPSTTEGRRLLAHELAHVVQQERGS